MRVLLVEDDKIIGDGVSAGLDLEGYAIDWVEDKESAETALDTNKYGLVVLDIGLPDGSGIDILKKLREKKDDVPVIILTAYDDVSYRVKGLDAGADDYLVKPFKLDELKARLRALRRRSNGKSEPVLKVRDIVLNPSTKTVMKNGQNVQLGHKEFAILQTLMENAGKLISKAQLEDGLYGWENEIESNTVEVHIHGIRKKLGKDLIETVKFVGYRINKDSPVQ
jgi:DNA-binding response OmpR family regulator